MITYVFLTLVYFFFCSFFFIFLNKKNPFLILIILELQLLIACMLFIIFSSMSHSIIGYVVALYIIAFAGAEAAVGIAVLILFYRLRGLFSIFFPTSLRVYN